MPGQAAILCNLGTPDAATPSAVRQFLKRFLSDQRVVELPAILWRPLLYAVILPLRCKRVAHAYESIWMEEGSPLSVFTRRQAQALQASLDARDKPVHVEYAMSYSEPMLHAVLLKLLEQDIDDILLLPMYPQYSATTSAVVYDQLATFTSQQRKLPSIRIIKDYHDHPMYISALANSIREHRERNGAGDYLLFSFHGLPEVNTKKGDPYQAQCQRTAELVAEKLGLEASQWRLGFQSRFGKQEWIKPYISSILPELAAAGHSVDVVCPSFAADCLETLEEIKLQAAEDFMAAGGKGFSMIPCLNDRPDHIALLHELLRNNIA